MTSSSGSWPRVARQTQCCPRRRRATTPAWAPPGCGSSIPWTGPESSGRAGDSAWSVASVEESIDKGRVPDPGFGASRNRQQTTTLLDAVAEHGFDACFGGARRDEEKARAKERVLSFRDDFGQPDPRPRRPELWSLYNGRIRKGEHIRAFPISNWTELDVDVWQSIEREQPGDTAHVLRPPPQRRRARRHAPGRERVGTAPPGRGSHGHHRPLPHGGRHELHRSGGVRRIDAWGDHRRGGGHPDHRARATRADDRFSEAAMEDRKKEGEAHDRTGAGRRAPAGGIMGTA
jgi:sulfate adenylyltransferase subunit 2